MSQVALAGSFRTTANPFFGSSDMGFPDSEASAQATCAEPGPWQASQETSSSDQVVV